MLHILSFYAIENIYFSLSLSQVQQIKSEQDKRARLVPKYISKGREKKQVLGDSSKLLPNRLNT